MFCLMAGSGGALAQGILAPGPDDFEKPAAWQTASAIQNGGIPPEVGSNSPPAGPVELGPLDVHPHLLYQFIYGDGIPATPTNHLKTVIQEISPGLLAYWGSHLTLDYTPTLRLYSNPQFANGTDQSVSLVGRATSQDWTFSLSQYYNSSDEALLQTETPTKVETFLTSFVANRQLGSRLSAQVSLSQRFSTTAASDLYQDLHEWSISPALNCQFSPQFGIGVNGAAGLDQISPGSGDTFEQMGGQMNFQPGKKLALTASAGLEVRQLLGSQLINPIFNAAFTYRPAEQTAVSLNAARAVTPSFFEDEVTVTTSLSGTLRQRFFGKFSLEGSLGYTTTPYVGFETFSNPNPSFNPNVTDFYGIPITPATLVSQVQTSRTDYYRFARVSLSFPLLKKGSASLFCQESDITSGLSSLVLTSTQVGLQLGYRF